MRNQNVILTLLFLFAIATALVATAAHADTLLVPGEFPTIQAAMTAAQNGDTVLVADGTYTGPGNNNLYFYGKVFTVRSENGPENCTIDCGGDTVGFWFDFNPPETVVDGFTITNGGGYPGGGMYMYYDGNPTIRNCIITGNSSGPSGGGGILLEGAFPTIINCTITGNTASSVGGGGIYCLMSNPTITNCVITGNTTTGAGVYCAEGSNPTITNSILWGDTPEEIYVDAFSTIVVRYSDVQGDWEGDGNINADPAFVAGPLGPFYLSQIAAGQALDSPCVDAGDPNSPLTEDTTRTDHELDTGVVDMGMHYAIGEGTELIRGDTNQDNSINVADAITLLDHLFNGIPADDCLSALDGNDDGGVNVADAVYVLEYLFNNGPNPPAPFPGCGEDGTPDTACDSYPCP
jgi:parallel beta-helix repeat protein